MHDFDFTQHRTWEICYENSNNAKIPRGITQPFLYSYVKYVKQIVEFAKRRILEVSILWLFQWNFLGVDSRDLKFCMKTPWTPRKLFCLVNFEF